MEKKYELIKSHNDWYEIVALKDFTLITGETVKKGDKWGYVKSEKCLSHEGNCWIMHGARVEGTVSDNAVVQDSATVYGTVSGNAVVKDYAEVFPLALVTDNAVVKESQHIRCGVVTTDLLRYKLWSIALFTELGVTTICGKALLCTLGHETEDPNVYLINDKTTITIGKEFVATAENGFSRGFSLTTENILDENDQFNGYQIACLIDVKDIIDVQGGRATVKKFTPIHAEW